jgi:hypothetical protein
MKTLISPKEIKIGQFYKSLGSDGYYYLGVLNGKRKRLVCINIDYRETLDSGENPLFPDYLIKDWEMVECNQSEVIEYAK